MSGQRGRLLRLEAQQTPAAELRLTITRRIVERGEDGVPVTVSIERRDVVVKAGGPA